MGGLVDWLSYLSCTLVSFSFQFVELFGIDGRFDDETDGALHNDDGIYNVN